MDVAILVKEFPPNVIGGTETQTMRMARKLSEAGHTVTVVTKSYPDAPGMDDEPFDLVRIPNVRRSPFFSTLTFVVGAFAWLLWRRDRFDIVQCMMIYPNGFIGYLLNALTGLPYFAWIRGGDYYFMKDNRIKRWMIDRVFRDTLVLTQTETVKADVLEEFPYATVDVLGNGVTVPDETASGDAVVFVGRLKRQKGVHVLLGAMEGIDERLLVVGDGPERETLESSAEELGVDAEFVGEVPPESVTNYLRDGAVFVLPSVEGEGLPNALLEAMAVGLPVIATDTGGVRDAIIEGETGYVATPGDREELADCLRRLTSDPSRADRMGHRAREYVVSNHSWTYIVDRLDDLYREVTDGSIPS